MKIVDLNGTWLLKGFDFGGGDEEKAYEADYDDSNWLKACVPGVSHLDLIRHKMIPNPFFNMNELEVSWVEDKDWWYRKRFTIGKDLLNSDKVELIFEGLDTFADVWLNGEKIGSFSNMFIEQKVDVKANLKEGENIIAVKFASPKKTLEERYGASDVRLGAAFYPPVVYGRKAQYSFGWDWGPRLPTSGIWRPAWIKAYNVCKIESFHFKPTLNGSGNISGASIEVNLEAFRGEEVEVRVSLKGHGYAAVKEERMILTPGRNDITFKLDVGEPRLWWPNGYGDQPLYDLEIDVTKDGTSQDRLIKRVGFRRIEVVREKDGEGETFYFRVNGVPIFCKGANWVPADSFLPQVKRERYEDLIGKAKEANMNMLRVWGGGIYENEEFYDICDEKGIMVWQDFMFSCGEYPEEDWFHDEVKREAEEVVKRLRNHACLAIWCGNNENDWAYKANWYGRKERFYGHTIYHKILPEVCGRLDPETFYWPSSPYGGEDPNSQKEGDRHSWDVWSGLRDYEEYVNDNGRFVSEFGFQSMPSLATIMRYTTPEDRYPQSKVIEHHNKQKGGPERLVFFLAHHFKVPCDLMMFSYLTQVNQGEAMKTGIMHWRRRKFRSAGALIWQLNDCWPVASWSLIDYYGALKASYYYTKRAFDNMTLSLVLNGDSIEAWAVSDLLDEKDGVLEIAVFKIGGAKIFSRIIDVTIPGNSSNLLIRLPLSDLKIQDPSNLVIVGILKVRSLEPSYDTLFLDQWKYINFVKPKIKLTVARALDKDGRRFELKVVSNTFVKALKLEVRGMEAIFSDNCYDMIPKVERNLEVRLERPLKSSELKRRIRFYHCW